MLLKPNALFAALFLLSLPMLATSSENAPIPEKFILRRNMEVNCNPDLVFVVEHGTFTPELLLKQVRSFINSFIGAAAVLKGNVVRAAIVEYATDAKIRVTLKDWSKFNLNDFEPLPSALGSSNDVHTALKLVIDEILQNKAGYVEANPNWVFLITSQDPSDVAKAAQLATTINDLSTLVVVAIGELPTEASMLQLTTDEDFFFRVKLFTSKKQRTEYMIEECGVLTLDFCKIEYMTTTTTTTTTTLSTPLPDPPSASEICNKCRNRRNIKDYYPDPDSCYHFYQCFFINETYAIGHRRVCPPGLFWHDEILACLPEGNVPCYDTCYADEAVAAHGCYGVPNICSQFVLCSNGASYSFCCPPGTSFVYEKCGCEADDTCTDECVIPAQPATTENPPIVIDELTCVDSYGVTLEVVPGRRDLYVSVDKSDPENIVKKTQPCATGSLFDLARCRCSDSVEIDVNQPSSKQCLLWLPFNTDITDSSINHFTTFLYGGGVVNSGAAAHGAGSFLVDGGRIEVPGLKTVDLQNAATICLFFRCENQGGNSPYACASSGGLVSNNNDSTLIDFSAIVASRPGSVIGHLRFWHSFTGQQSVNAPVSANGWNQACVVYDGAIVTLYVNGVVSQQQPAIGNIAIGHCPYTIGNDQYYGQFSGRIDEVLICGSAFSQADVNAHFTGDNAYLAQQGYIPN